MKSAHIVCFGMLAAATLCSHASDRATAGQTAVTRADRVNVRALPSKQSEVLGSLPKGQSVTILGTTNGVPEEATTWNEIALPEQVGVWVYGPLLDSKNSLVKAKKANLRAGPGVNYSEMGDIPQGAPVTVIRKVDEWYQISAPPGAHAYVAANLLEPVAPAPAVATAVKRANPMVIPPLALAPAIPRTAVPPVSGTLPPESDPRVLAPRTTISEAPKVVIDPAPPLVKEAQPEIVAETLPAVVAPVRQTIVTTTTTVTKAGNFEAVGTAIQPPVVYTDQVRQVFREGTVARSFNPKTPSFYELQSLRSGEGLQDYLITDDPAVVLKNFKGHHVFVTGEEYVDPSYGKVPVIRVKSITDAK